VAGIGTEIMMMQKSWCQGKSRKEKGKISFDLN
jgi:hypothetical protein